MQGIYIILFVKKCMYEEICLKSPMQSSPKKHHFLSTYHPFAWEGVENVQSYCSVFSFTSKIIAAIGWREGERERERDVG